MKKLLLILASILLLTNVSNADSQNNKKLNNNALKGVTESKSYFDVTIGEPKLLNIRLQLIEQTYNQLVAAGVTPTFVIGIRGKASNYFTVGQDYVLEIDLPDKQRIEALTKKLKSMGVIIEQCQIAAGFQEINIADFLPQVEVIANGYVSMIGYHSQGYGFIPMD